MQRPDRPYRIIGRELQYRLNRKGEEKSKLAKAIGIPINSLDSIMRGYRPFPSEKIDKASAFLARGDGDDKKLREILNAANTPGASRLLLLQNFEEPLQIGYVEWHPFAAPGLGTEPGGMLVDLMHLLCNLLQLPYEWRRLKFHEMVPSLRNGDVDLVVGFVLETLYRRAHASFVPLFLPYRVGINAVTRSSEFTPNARPQLILDELKAASSRSDNQIKFVTVKGELADEYLPALVPGAKSLQEKELSIEHAIRHHVQRSDRVVVFADHVSCQRAIDDITEADDRLHQLFKDPLGRFQGGFLLPFDDNDWTEYFQTAFKHLLLAKLPATMGIIGRYADQTSQWLDDAPEIDGFSSSPNAYSFVGLDQWLNLCWDDKVRDIPTSWYVKSRRARQEQEVK